MPDARWVVLPGQLAGAEVSPRALALAVRLAVQGRTEVGQAALGALMGWSERTVRRAVGDLVAVGALEVVGEMGGLRTYRLAYQAPEVVLPLAEPAAEAAEDEQGGDRPNLAGVPRPGHKNTEGLSANSLSGADLGGPAKNGRGDRPNLAGGPVPPFSPPSPITPPPSLSPSASPRAREEKSTLSTRPTGVPERDPLESVPRVADLLAVVPATYHAQVRASLRASLEPGAWASWLLESVRGLGATAALPAPSGEEVGVVLTEMAIVSQRPSPALFRACLRRWRDEQRGMAVGRGSPGGPEAEYARALARAAARDRGGR